ncbi:MAG: SUMF1/EgtB/PvdO family nonheme iron enzyme [Bacteroidota bacterium]
MYTRNILLLSILFVCTAFNGKEKPLFSKKLKAYPFVPSGVYYAEPIVHYKQERYDSMYIAVQGFFMAEKEVTNKQYRQFLEALKNEGRTADYAAANVIDDNWSMAPLSYGQPYTSNYFFHPAYNEFPVVNVPFEGAIQYCAWLTKALHHQFPGKYDQYAFRLPTKSEFIFAAKGGGTYVTYSWGPPFLPDRKGRFQAKFYAVGAEKIYKDPDSGELKVAGSVNNAGLWFPDHPTFAISYAPNDYGLYNMSGNVAEMIQDQGTAMGGSWASTGYDIRVFSEMPYDEPNPEVGFRPVLAVSNNQF